MSKYLKIYFAVGIVAALPVMLLRDFTPDNELRYLVIADEALRSGSLFAFTLDGVPYADKPPLYLWIAMAARRLFGSECMWFMCLFSLLPALGVVAVMDRWVQHVADARHRRMAALMLLTTVFFAALALTVRMDMLMCLFITLALYHFWRDNPCRMALFTFLAIFTKGPVGALVPLLSTVTYLLWRHWGEGRMACLRAVCHFWGWRQWLILSGLLAAWFGMVYAEGGYDYFHNLVFDQTLGRTLGTYDATAAHISAHSKPVYYYLIAVWYSIGLWMPLLAYLLYSGIRLRIRLHPLEVFFLFVAATTFVALSLSSTKLPVYLLPIFPFCIYLGASVLPRCPLPLSFARVHTAMVRWVPPVLAAGLFVCGCAMPWLNPYIGYRDLCAEVERQAKPGTHGRIYTYGIERPEGLNAYTEREIVVCDSLDFALLGPEMILRDAVLVARQSSQIPKLPVTDGLVYVGNYMIMTLKTIDNE